MEGLIPLLLRSMKKQRPQKAYRCLSENSTGRSYHLLLAGDSADGSSHRRTGSDFRQPTAVDYLPENRTQARSLAVRDPAASPASTENGLRQRGFTSAAHYQDLAGINAG